MMHEVVLIKSIPNHKKHKPKLLNFIKEVPLNPYKTVSHTDWNLERNSAIGYHQYLYTSIIPAYMDEAKKFVKGALWNIADMWFQQYEKYDYHPWHSHAHVQFSHIYYVELPHKTNRTEFFDLIKNKKVTYDVKEGDIIMFPSFMPHHSLPHTSSAPKTIISFNSNFEVDENFILGKL